MPVVVILAVAAVVALAAAPLRRNLVVGPQHSDRRVLRVDQSVTTTLVALLAAAAIVAGALAPVDGAMLVSIEVLAVVVAAVGGGYPVRVMLHAGGIPTRSDNFDDQPGDAALLRGGRVIGVMERTAVAACLVLAWPAGLAVILAVKSLARFPELREHRASEQFIIGTFASVLWAAAAAGVGVLAGF